MREAMRRWGSAVVLAVTAGAVLGWSLPAAAQEDPCSGTTCGAPVTNGSPPTASDALFALRAAVGSETCPACVCDVDSSGSVTASDALAILRRAVGLGAALVCPPPSTTTTAPSTSTTTLSPTTSTLPPTTTTILGTTTTTITTTTVTTPPTTLPPTTSTTVSTSTTTTTLDPCAGVDCSSLDDACNVGVCQGGACQAQALENGTGCDDAVVCTGPDVCTDGLCAGPDSCTAGEVCDAMSDSCVNTDAAAFVSITPTGGIDASTFNTDSVTIENTSSDASSITRIRFDFTTALLPDLVFDPDGVAGDTVAKCFSADSGAAATGLDAPADPCVSPFSSPHDDGFDVLELTFSDFEPGETFGFSVDVDPTSIRGASGSAAAGSVSGLELVGTVVEVEFDDGSLFFAHLYREPSSASGGENIVKAVPPVAPGVEVLGVTPPAAVSDASQTVRVSAAPGDSIRLLQVEGTLDLGGTAGFDLDPFEANSAVAIEEHFAVVGGSGFIDVPVLLTRSSADAGFNHFVAVVVDADASGRTGLASSALVVELSAP